MTKLAISILALMLAACGGGKGDTQAEETTKPQATEASMPPDGDPLWSIPPDRSPIWQKIDPVTLKPV